MSSSIFEVIETESETEKDLTFGLEACEENGIGLSAQVDGEIQKDHTYTKDPDNSDEEEENAKDSQQEENEKLDASREKRTAKNSKAGRRTNPRNAKIKKDVSPKKETPTSKKVKAKKDVLTEESNKSDDNSKSEEKNIHEDNSKSLKRGRKRKVEEKENVIDRSIVEEVQNINEGESITKPSSDNPPKKKNSPDQPKSKTGTKSPAIDDGEDNQNVPKGWVRKVVVRKSGKTAGQVDVYIYSPDGIKFRSRPDVAAYLAKTKSNLKLEDFNFSKRNISEDSVTKVIPKKEKTPSAKPKCTPEKKKAKEPTTPKKGSKLLVKLSFSPKSRKGKNAKKIPAKQKKQGRKSAKNVKTSGSSSKASRKKKSA